MNNLNEGDLVKIEGHVCVVVNPVPNIYGEIKVRDRFIFIDVKPENISATKSAAPESSA